MNKHDISCLIAGLRRSVPNFSLLEATSTGACTVSEIAQRMGIPATHLHVKLARAREAARKGLMGVQMDDLLPEDEIQRESLD
jgi:hypothetical protein